MPYIIVWLLRNNGKAKKLFDQGGANKAGLKR